MKNNITGLRRVQLAELKIIKEIKRVCDENDITYYISGGTYLGSVRHKGFIPWDDDADIAMPRSEFEKFLKVAPNKLSADFELKTYKNDPTYPYYVPKVIDNSVKLVDKSGVKDKIVPAWVDVFPLDGFPDSKLPAAIHKFDLLSKRALYNLSAFDDIVKVDTKNRPMVEKILIWLGKNTSIFSRLDPIKRMDKITKSLKKYPDITSENYMNFMGSYKFKSVLNKEHIYGEGAFYEFEGDQFWGPKNYDEYLTVIYGDYMKIPKIEDQNKHSTEVLEDE
ncbi:LicD family protein [Enterococcus faecium]|nr:LicD family protein [Enterococcus faecium]NTR54819.1 LicD family protein [Enterococcus faecium]